MKGTPEPTLILDFDQRRRLTACTVCGLPPARVPLGDPCPASDPDDPGFHQFWPGGEAA